jgi:hypothetical protein
VRRLYNPQTHYLRELGKRNVPLRAPGLGSGKEAPKDTFSKNSIADDGSTSPSSVLATIVKIQPLAAAAANSEKSEAGGKKKNSQALATLKAKLENTASSLAKVREKEIEINTSISDHDLLVKTKKMREWLKITSPSAASPKKSIQISATHLKVTLIDKSKAKIQATSNSSLPELYKKVMDAVGDCAQPLGAAKPLLKNKKLVFTLKNKV